MFAARDAGVSDEEIGQLTASTGTAHWNPLEAALLRAVEELIADGAMAEETWTVLAGQLNTQQLLDVVVTVGAYETVAWLLRSFAVDLDDDLTCG